MGGILADGSVAVVTMTSAQYRAARAAASVMPELPLVVYEPGQASSLFSALALRADGVLSVSDEALLVSRMRTFTEDMTIVVCDLELADHWFLHWHPAVRTVVVSSARWGALTSLPLPAFLAYELLMHGLRAVSPTYDNRALLHRETRGCLFDLCEQRQEIEKKKGGVPVDLVLRLCDRVRALAIAPRPGSSSPSPSSPGLGA